MKNKIYMITIIILILIIAFQFILYENNKPIKVEIINKKYHPEILKNKVLTKGDTAAYKELEFAFFDENRLDEYLIYSIIMANKYNYPLAYYNVYHYLSSFYENHEIGVFDENTKELAMKYLKKGAELNDPESIRELGDLYMKGLYLKKDTLIGKVLLERAKKI